MSKETRKMGDEVRSMTFTITPEDSLEIGALSLKAKLEAEKKEAEKQNEDDV